MIYLHRNLFITILSLIGYTFVGCQQEEPYVITCNDGDVKWEFAPQMYASLKNVGDLPNYIPTIKLKIQSQAEYEHYVSGNYLPAIDFERKTLIIVRTDERLSYTANYFVTADCVKNELRWEIEAYDLDGRPQNPEESLLFIFAILVPKTNDNTVLIYRPKILDSK